MTRSMLRAESGELRKGEKDKYTLTLEGNQIYWIELDAIEEDVDFDIKVFDENNIVVESDLDPDSDAEVELIPAWTGDFTIVVSMVRGASKYSIVVWYYP